MDKIGEIITKLLARIKQSKLKWEPTADKDTFVAPLANGAVTLAQLRSQSGRTNVLALFDPNGIEIGSYSSHRITPSPLINIFYKTDQTWPNMLHELYTVARRSSLQIDKKLDLILSDLEGD